MTIASSLYSGASSAELPAASAAERIAWAIFEEKACQISEVHWHRSLLDPLRDFLNRPGKEFRGSLVLSSWTLAGGDPEAMPPTLPLVLELLHAGSLIVDDIQDGSETRRGKPALHKTFGMPVALNAGNWLYFAATSLLDELELSATIKLELLRHVRHAVLRCHQGQGLDLTTRVSTLDPNEIVGVVSATTDLKTASLVELAAVLGARASGADKRCVKALAAFARELGTVLQMLDDLGGVLSNTRQLKGDEDLREGRPTWVWAAAAENLPRAALVRLQALSGLVESGHPVAALRQNLRHAVPVGARDHASARLRRAYHELAEHLDPSPALDGVADDIDRLEKSYA